MKLNLDFALYKGTTRLKQWWKTVKEHFTAVQTAVNALDDDIADEATERERVDGVLFGNITDTAAAIAAEASARGAADDTLDRQIKNETQSRTNADIALRHSVDVLQKILNFDRDITDIQSVSEGISFPSAQEPAGTPMVIENDTENDISSITLDGGIIYWFDNPIPSGEYRLCYVTRDGDDVDTGMVHVVDYDADISALAARLTTAQNAINELKDKVAAIETNMPISATAAEIRDAWNPTPEPEPEPETSAVTISGTYDDVNSALIVTSTELDKLAAIDEGETFDLVIHASGVEYSGAAKKVNYIGLSTTGEPPGYVTEDIPLWDTEYDYDTFHGCVMVSQYDRVDNGEIKCGSY